ncbi:hypothetical protein AB1K54_08135 [Microbacterium sp. BWT-B31]|uniref:hypothetical protein n=1 Tax=Microbacterium sp. BWT-B31 TaxID=3232072 RepID=UPI0035281C5B
MNQLLTDDEILAAAAAAGRNWPLPLLTVRNEPAALRAAAFRGLRSLIVRGLATPLEQETTTIEPRLRALIERIADARRATIAHVSLSERPVLAGSSYAVFADDAGLVVDVGNAMGVHAISTSDVRGGMNGLVEFVRTRFAPRPDVRLPESGCVLVADSPGERSLRVRPGLIEIGSMRRGADGMRFDTDESTADFGFVERLFANAA